MMKSGWRKYSLAAAGLLFSTALCFTGHISGEAWVAAFAMGLGIHGAANVVDKVKGGAG